jgi:hypothetical protein
MDKQKEPTDAMGAMTVRKQPMVLVARGPSAVRQLALVAERRRASAPAQDTCMSFRPVAFYQ